MTKYCQWPSSLDDIRCSFTKADVVLLPTLAFNEETIVGTINVLQTIANRFGLTNEMVSNKVIIMQGDLLTVRNT